MAGDIEEEPAEAEPAEEDVAATDDELISAEESFGDDEEEMSDAPTWIPVRKMASAPFTRNGVQQMLYM